LWKRETRLQVDRHWGSCIAGTVPFNNHKFLLVLPFWETAEHFRYGALDSVSATSVAVIKTDLGFGGTTPEELSGSGVSDPDNERSLFKVVNESGGGGHHVFGSHIMRHAGIESHACIDLSYSRFTGN